MKSLATRVAELEADVLALKAGKTGGTTVPLIAAAELALERLREFYEDKRPQIDDRPDENEDYVCVCSPIPALERALEAVRGTNHKKPKKVVRQ